VPIRKQEIRWSDWGTATAVFSLIKGKPFKSSWMWRLLQKWPA